MNAGRMSEILRLIADTLEQGAAIATPAQTDKIVALVNDLAAKWKTMLQDGTVTDLIEFCRRFADRRLILRVISLFAEPMQVKPIRKPRRKKRRK